MSTPGDTAELSSDELLTASLRALMGARRVKVPDVCARLHMSRSTYFSRMSDGGWTFAEAAEMAEMFGVSMDALRGGIGLLTVTYTGPYLAVSADIAEETPRLRDHLAVVVDQ